MAIGGTVAYFLYSHLLPPMQQQLADCIDNSLGDVLESVIKQKKSVALAKALATESVKAGAEGGSRTRMPEGARF